MINTKAVVDVCRAGNVGGVLLLVVLPRETNDVLGEVIAWRR